MILGLMVALGRGPENRFTGTPHQSLIVSVGLTVLWSTRADRQGCKKKKKKVGDKDRCSVEIASVVSRGPEWQNIVT